MNEIDDKYCDVIILIVRIYEKTKYDREFRNRFVDELLKLLREKIEVLDV